MLTKLDEIGTGDHVSTEKLCSGGVLQEAAREYVRSAMRANLDLGKNDFSDIKYIADKSAFVCILSLRRYPEQFAYAAILSKYFPDAKKILLIRDVRDVIVSFSAWKKQQRGSLLRASPISYYWFIRYVRNWIILHRQWLKDARKDKNFLVIHYKDMKSRFTETMQEVFSFLELDVDNNFLQELNRDLFSITGKVFEQENKKRGYSFFRSGKVGEWQQEFSWYHRAVTEMLYKREIEDITSAASILYDD